MYIPDSILNKGGNHLELYVKTLKEIEKMGNEISEIEEKVEECFVEIQNLIGGYLKKGKSYSEYEFYFKDVRAKRNGTSFMRDIEPLQNVYATEEMLKNIRELTLDERAAQIKRDNLKYEIKRLEGKQN